MSTRRVIKILDKAYDDGFNHGLSSVVPPLAPHYSEGIWSLLNRYIGWAYHAGARDGARVREATVRDIAAAVSLPVEEQQ